MNLDLSGSVVLIAGGTGELGSAASMVYFEGGASVVVAFRRLEEYVALQITLDTKA